MVMNSTEMAEFSIESGLKEAKNILRESAIYKAIEEEAGKGKNQLCLTLNTYKSCSGLLRELISEVKALSLLGYNVSASRDGLGWLSDVYRVVCNDNCTEEVFINIDW